MDGSAVIGLFIMGTALVLFGVVGLLLVGLSFMLGFSIWWAIGITVAIPIIVLWRFIRA